MSVPKFVFGSEAWVDRNENCIKMIASSWDNSYLLHGTFYYSKEIPLTL
jgi:hypothetical protein